MFDAIVIGLGAMGSAALFELARRGVKALGIERFESPHDRGSTHGQSRVIRQAYFEGARYVPLVQRAYALWHELERLSGETLLLPTGGLYFGPESSAVVRGSIRSAGQYRIPHEVLTGAEIRRRFPPIVAPDDCVGLYEPSAGVLPPERCVSIFRALALDRGAQILDHTAVLGWSATKSSVEVRTAAQTHRARSVILTPGAWMPALLNGLDLHLNVQRLAMFWFQPPAGIDAFRPGRFPLYLCESPDIQAPPDMRESCRKVFLYGLPALGTPQEGVKIAFHNISFPVPDPNAVSRNVLAIETLQMREYLRHYLPSLDGPLVRTATCLYTMTPDEHFIIDRHPASPRVVIASCCSGHGFKFAPAIAEALACLALDEKPPLDVDAFKVRTDASAR